MCALNPFFCVIYFHEHEQDKAVLKPFCLYYELKKSKGTPLQTWSGPEVSRKLRFPNFMTTTQDGGRLSALRTGRLYPQEILLELIYVRG